MFFPTSENTYYPPIPPETETDDQRLGRDRLRQALSTTTARNHLPSSSDENPDDTHSSGLSEASVAGQSEAGEIASVEGAEESFTNLRNLRNLHVDVPINKVSIEDVPTQREIIEEIQSLNRDLEVVLPKFSLPSSNNSFIRRQYAEDDSNGYGRIVEGKKVEGNEDLHCVYSTTRRPLDPQIEKAAGPVAVAAEVGGAAAAIEAPNSEGSEGGRPGRKRRSSQRDSSPAARNVRRRGQPMDETRDQRAAGAARDNAGSAAIEAAGGGEVRGEASRRRRQRDSPPTEREPQNQRKRRTGR
jgi:hypothetical protein